MLGRFAGTTRFRPGRVEIDVAKRHAWLDGRPLVLSALPLRILEQLIGAEGRILTRVELKRMLWPYAERIDTERRLNTAIRALREALGDSAAEPRLILTVRGYGYRWIGGERKAPGMQSYLPIAAAACLALIAAPASLNPVQQIATRGPQAIDAHWRSSEVAYRAALRANPADLGARSGLTWLYVNQRRSADALPHIALLLQADRRRAIADDQLGWLLLRAGMPEAALTVCSEADEPSLNLLSCRQTALARIGLISNARDVALKLMHLAKADPAAIASVSEVPASLGYARFLRWRIGAFLRPNGDWFQRAQLEADAGMYQDALASLRRAAAADDPFLVKIASTAEFAPLHRTAEYRRIESAVFAKARVS